MNEYFDVVIIGSGPAGLGAAFHLAESGKNLKIALLDKARFSSGGLRNDCKQNYTFPVGFSPVLWSKDEAEHYLELVAKHLKPHIEEKRNIEVYQQRAEKLGVKLISIKQAHVGTDKTKSLITQLLRWLEKRNVSLFLDHEVDRIDFPQRSLILKKELPVVQFKDLVIAPGRAGFQWLQDCMDSLGIEYSDNVVDVGIRVETREENYKIVKDYYDPKFLFQDDVRTFCTNSGAAYVVRETYDNYFSVNGHSLSTEKQPNGLVNFAMLKTITLTDPVVSGHQFADILGQMAMQLSGGKPMMQRVGDFRMGKRSKMSTFNHDLYDFEPTLKSATPGDVSLAMPAKILRDIWKSLKMLDTIIPGVLYPSTIIYYPEIKTYANRPTFLNDHFLVKENIYMIGDGAGTSRGITAAWASGIRAAKGILETE